MADCDFAESSELGRSIVPLQSLGYAPRHRALIRERCDGKRKLKTEDALAGDRWWANEESDLPLVGNDDGIGLGRGSSQLHDDNDGRSSGSRHQRVHDDAQLTMISVRLVRVQVGGLSEGQHRQQDQT